MRGGGKLFVRQKNAERPRKVLSSSDSQGLPIQGKRLVAQNLQVEKKANAPGVVKNHGWAGEDGRTEMRMKRVCACVGVCARGGVCDREKDRKGNLVIVCWGKNVLNGIQVTTCWPEPLNNDYSGSWRSMCECVRRCRRWVLGKERWGSKNKPATLTNQTPPRPRGRKMIRNKREKLCYKSARN